MRKVTWGAAVVWAVVAGACGGESETMPPPAPPPPPPMVIAPSAPVPPPPSAPEPPKPTLLELEKQAVQSSYAALNAHDAKKAAELFTPDATVEAYGMPVTKGRDAIAEGYGVLFTAFPDFKAAPTRVFMKGDVAVIEFGVTGTHKGDFLGVKATDKPIGVNGVNVLWFTAEGLVRQEHHYVDVPTLMAQIGVSKQPTRAIPVLPREPEVVVSAGTPEEDKLLDVAKPFLTAIEKKSEADFLGPLADDIVWIDVATPKDSTGKDQAKKFFQMYTKAFSDVKVNVDGAWAIGNYIVAESTTSGTHTGPLGPLKPTKKAVAMHGVDIMQMKDGKIVKGTSYSNSAELLGQLGLLPKPKGDAAKGAKANDPSAKGDAPKPKGKPSGDNKPSPEGAKN